MAAVIEWIRDEEATFSIQVEVATAISVTTLETLKLPIHTNNMGVIHISRDITAVTLVLADMEDMMALIFAMAPEIREIEAAEAVDEISMTTTEQE